jgi:uncharacterized BrkB/YihY/UPF0761 family membrane protein
LYEGDVELNQIESTQRNDIKAWLSLILGCVSILCVVFAPIVLTTGIVGLILGVLSRKGPNRRIAIAGIVTSVLAIVLSILLGLFLIVNSSSVNPVKSDTVTVHAIQP